MNRQLYKIQQLPLENKSNTILNQASSITNDTPIVNNTGNVETSGYDRANPNLNPV